MPIITVFADVVIQNSIIAAGIRGKNMRKNARVPVDNGAESINIVWDQTLREFELGFKPMIVSAWQAIETLHEITEGGAFGFLMEDPKDRQVTDGVVSSLTSTTFQLYKRYLDAPSGRFKLRKITRPRASGFAPSISGVPIAPANYTLNVTTGIITIPSAPAASAVTWTGSIYVPVHFADDNIDWTLVVAGAYDARFLAGPSVMLKEIRE